MSVWQIRISHRQQRKTCTANLNQKKCPGLPGIFKELSLDQVLRQNLFECTAQFQPA